MKNRPKIKSEAQLFAEINEWNHNHQVGCEVLVRLDDGSIKHTTTTSQAMVLSGHSSVIMLEGISGCYALDRVKPAAH